MTDPALVPVERRQYVRFGLTLPATIWLRADAKRQPCMVLDVSRGGGRVRLLPGTRVPDSFTLLLTPCGRVRRACRVIWRRDDQIGVEFCGRFDRL